VSARGVQGRKGVFGQGGRRCPHTSATSALPRDDTAYRASELEEPTKKRTETIPISVPGGGSTTKNLTKRAGEPKYDPSKKLLKEKE